MSKSKRSSNTRKRTGAKATAAAAIELVVRRGALRRFDRLKQKAAALPVTVLWDRRQDERRTSSFEVSREHRRAERRQKPPFTWELADFVVVEKRSAPGARAKRTKRK